MCVCCAPASYCCGVPSSTETIKQKTDILPGSRAGTPVCQRANPAVAVVRHSRCRAVGFIPAAVGCVYAVGLSCAVCVLAMWLQMWLQDDHDTPRRTRVIQGSRSLQFAFSYYCVWCCRSVHHFERAWFTRQPDTDRLKTVILRAPITQITSAGGVMKNMYNFVG